MRLLTSDEPHFGGTIVLKEYIGSQIPPYAILSHRWTDDEISYEDMSKGWSTLPAAGRDKIEKFCRLAGFNGYSHAWVDTCCIDKRSSAELTESINSMYNWYGEAAICYAYLNDVPDNEEVVQDPVFARSVWFTRGWTLQELIAPSRVIFFSNGWNEIGEKHTLARRLAQITDIDVHVLGGAKHPYECSVAQRMAWAANRVTTRREDIAYSLLGLFDVNMPLLYGEGEKAFIRLQEEIVRISDDDSLFAWKDETASPMDCHGLLANSPKHFRESRHIWCPASRMDRQPYTITNRGIRI
ncbi:HET-domain-containing protein, partial [Saccharata proteae CBS 121410]